MGERSGVDLDLLAVDASGVVGGEEGEHLGEHEIGIICQQGAIAMPTRNVVLGQQQHEFVDALVASGRYQNASEVLREGLRLLERRDAEATARLAALRAAADRGWADVAAGHYVDIDDAELDEVIARIGARAVSDGRSAG